MKKIENFLPFKLETRFKMKKILTNFLPQENSMNFLDHSKSIKDFEGFKLQGDLK